MSKRDDVNCLYKQSQKLNNVCLVLFWVNVGFAMISLLPFITITSIIISAQILISALYIILKIIDDGCLWYNAEAARRKNNLQVALDLNLSDLETEGYYNNREEPSLIKYAVNTFESSYFSKENATRMLIKSFVKAGVSVVVLVIIGWISPSKDFLFVITQAVFSAYIIEEAIMLTIYKVKMDKLYDLFYTEFVTVGVSKQKQQYLLLSHVVEYEAVKAHYKVRLDTSWFNKHNEQLSSKWEEIQSKIVINPKLSR